MNSPLLKSLFSVLQQSGLAYCLWKGRVDLDNVLSGKDDVDMLVARKDSLCVQRHLLDLGFKLSQSGREKTFPGLIDYFGFDSAIGSIVHIQLYHQLICGERLVENLHLPIESALLETRIFDRGVAVPDPAAELTVFLIRKVAQYGSVALLRPGALRRFRADVAAEVAFLQDLTSFDNVKTFVGELLPMLDPALLEIAASIMLVLPERSELGKSNQPAGVLAWLRMRSSLMSQLSVCQRRGFFSKRYEWLCRRVIVGGYHLKYRGNRVRYPASGGRAIAIIGSDGTGKTTAVNFSRTFLSAAFQTSTYHMGRPSPSISSRLASRMVRVATKLSGGRMRMPRPGQSTESHWPNFLIWLPMWLAVLVARDRYRTYRKIRRDVGQGKCVIIDRYPIPGIDWMDSPMIHRIPEAAGKYDYLSRKERSYYEKMLAAEQTILLIVSPEVAAQRQVSDGYDYVIERAEKMHAVVSSLDESIEVIDTGCSLAEVQKRLIEKIWSCI
jgi:thymidylate kinase